jgi:Protein of unknown function (DUF3761)/Glucodextranase, domain B
MNWAKAVFAMREGRWSAHRMVPCALGVIAVVFCGCGGTTGATSGAQGPGSSAAPAKRVALHLNSGSYSLSDPSTRVSGTVSSGASVRVDGHAARVKGGHWSRTVGLHLGRNKVLVRAMMPGRSPARKSIRVTRKRSAVELEARAAAIALRAEARKRRAVEVELKVSAAAVACTNGTYVNSAGNTVCKPEESSSGAPAGATAKCEDGTYSFSESRSGTCSHHGGVAEWLS